MTDPQGGGYADDARARSQSSPYGGAAGQAPYGGMPQPPTYGGATPGAGGAGSPYGVPDAGAPRSPYESELTSPPPAESWGAGSASYGQQSYLQDYGQTGAAPAGYPQTGQVAYGQTGQVAYPQAGYPQTGQAGYPQAAQAAYGQTGQAVYPQTGQAAYPQAAQAGYPQTGQAVYPQTAQAGYPQSGQVAYGQTGQVAYPQAGYGQTGASPAGYAQPGAAAQAGTAQDYGYQQYGQPGAAQPGAAAAGYAQPGAAAQAGTAQDYGYQQYGQTSSPAAPAGRSSSGAETSAPANGNGAAGGGGPYAREDADRRTATGRQVVRPRGDDSWTGISDPPRRSQRGSGKGYGTGAVSARSGPISTRTAGAVPSARTGAVATRTGAVPTRTGAVPTRTGPVTEDRSSRRGRTGLNLPGRQGKERKTEEKREPQTPAEAVLSVVSEVFVVLGMALALSLVIKTFLIQAFLIPSESMQDTLTFRDRVLVNKLTPSPMSLSRGDVVVFKDPGGWLQEHQETEQQGAVQRGLTAALTFIGLLPQDAGQHLIKRVIGLPGDTVKCCDAEGKLTVNGVPITETYLKEGVKPSNDPFTTTVKPDHLWVLGDNRSNSYDSRFHVKEATQGQVPIANVVGKAFVLVWPFSRFTGLSGPPEVFARVPDPPAAGQK